ncbi:MAG: polyprenyl synthetase family protein [Nitrososphaerales archaeon]
MKDKDPLTLNMLMERMKNYYYQIEEAIKVELNRFKSSNFYDPLLYASEGGKRIRPMILLLSAESIGRIKDDPLPVAVAVELLHIESIIHDDILDNEIFRRDRPAFHIKYGLGTSLLTADFVFGIILDIASRYGDRRIAKELSSVALRMCEGELGELNIDSKIHRLSWDEYLKLISQKTASLFEVSAKIGGIVGGGNDKEIEILSEYGRFLGMAYQIRDDIQDWSKEDKIVNILNIEQNDKLSYLRSMSELYAIDAKKRLKSLKDTPAKKYLIDLADFMISNQFQG